MPKGLPRALLIGFALLLTAVVLQRLFFSSDENPSASEAVAVEVAPVRVLDVNDYRYFNGTLRPNAQFLITPKVGGLLLKLRRQFELVRTSEQFVRRQREGDDLDLDAIIEARGDQRAGIGSSDNACWTPSWTITW